MSKNHPSNHNHKTKHSPPHKSAWRVWHRNWKAWVIVGLMLAAMIAYVLSDNESLQPGGPVEEPMPAAAGV